MKKIIYKMLNLVKKCIFTIISLPLYMIALPTMMLTIFIALILKVLGKAFEMIDKYSIALKLDNIADNICDGFSTYHDVSVKK